jgi:hypothetical protein
VSITWNAAGDITGHVDLADPHPRPGYELVAPSTCCCGREHCDGGLADRLAAWGIDPAEVTEYRGTIPLGEK